MSGNTRLSERDGIHGNMENFEDERRTINSYASTIHLLMDRRTELRNRKLVYENEWIDLKDQIAELQKRLDILQYYRNDSENADVERLLSEATYSMAVLQRRIGQVENEIRSIDRDISTADEKIRDVQEKLTEKIGIYEVRAEQEEKAKTRKKNAITSFETVATKKYARDKALSASGNLKQKVEVYDKKIVAYKKLITAAQNAMKGVGYAESISVPDYTEEPDQPDTAESGGTVSKQEQDSPDNSAAFREQKVLDDVALAQIGSVIGDGNPEENADHMLAKQKGVDVSEIRYYREMLNLQWQEENGKMYLVPGNMTSNMRMHDNTERNTIDLANRSKTFVALYEALKEKKIDYRPIQKERIRRTQEFVIKSISGGDKTKGSCSSLAFAYAGNQAGYVVFDFRDGKSREFFSRRDNIEKIASLPNVRSISLTGTDDIEAVDQLFGDMSAEKEYYLCTGNHAAVVRCREGKREYLELQHSSDGNGWHELNDAVLISRFKCSSSHSVPYSNHLIEIDSLSKSRDFLDILGYINTSEAEQVKGVTGHVR